MRFCVFGKMIAPHEAFATNCAHISLFSSVRSVMTCEFVGTGELFLATCPITLERTLTSVCSEVGLEMATFPVLFITFRIMASVHFLFLFGSSAHIPASGSLFWFGDQFRGRVDNYTASSNARCLGLHQLCTSLLLRFFNFQSLARFSVCYRLSIVGKTRVFFDHKALFFHRSQDFREHQQRRSGGTLDASRCRFLGENF